MRGLGTILKGLPLIVRGLPLPIPQIIGGIVIPPIAPPVEPEPEPQPEPDVLVKRLAHRLYGVGYNGGAAPSTGDGTAKTYNATLVNLSGAPMQTISVVTQGWTTRTTGLADTGNGVDITATFEYPVGTVVGTFPVWTTPNSGIGESQDLVLPVFVPNGASFKINLSAIVPSGQKYLERLGFAGLRTHSLKSTLTKVALYAVGDSIMTNNNGAVYNAANNRCPAYHASISGTRASHYAATFNKQSELAAALGLTHMISDFGTNDFGAGTAWEAILDLLLMMKLAANAVGIKFVQTTILPRTLRIDPVALTNAKAVGFAIEATVPDASMFLVGNAYTIAGATQSEYNGSKICLSADVATNTVRFLFQGSATPTPTGSLTTVAWKVTSDIRWMIPFSSQFAPGPDAARGRLNAAIRSQFDDFIDWADACEPFRDSGRFRVAGEGDLLPLPQKIDVRSVVNMSRFTSTYDRGNGTMTNGMVQPLTGANIGLVRTGNGNTGGDITVSAAFTSTQVVGDQYLTVPGVSHMADDGTHPRVSAGGKGGQVHLDNATGAWIDAQLAQVSQT